MFGRSRTLTGLAIVLASILALVGFDLPALAQGGEGLVNLDGGSLAPRALEGDAVIVFFASWSPRCRDIVERTLALQRSWGDRAKVLLIAFQESEEDVRSFVAGSRGEIEVLRDVDGSFSKRHGITTLPSLLVLERGTVAFRGRLPADADSVIRPILD